MTTLNIPQTEHTPKILFDFENLEKGEYIFEISGESKPEDVKEFYSPVLNWLDNLQKELKIYQEAEDTRKRKIRMKFQMDYFNSSSAKLLFDIIQKLDEIQTNCHNSGIKILWQYHPQDVDMLESGEEFKSMSTVQFEIEALKS